MPSLGTLLSDSRSLMMAAILAVIVVVILVYGILRYVFGRRLHMTGGRGRQPRLGVVDAYDLDRQRQLVLVRRDNVEHLIMIGGPNDLLIESAFVRAQPSVVVSPGRDREVGLPGPAMPLPSLGPEPVAEDRATPAPAPPQPAPTPQPAQAASTPQALSFEIPPPVQVQAPRAPAPRPPAADLGRPVMPKDLGPLSDLPAPGPAAVPDPAGDAAAPSAAEPLAPPEPVAPAPVPIRPTRFPTAARPAGSPLPPRPSLTALRASIVPPTTGAPTPGTGPGGTGPARSTLPSLANRPTPLSPLQRGTSAASLRRDPLLTPPPADPVPVDASPPPPEPAAPRQELAPATPSLPTGRALENDPAITLDSIESLEEEMARLLGRAAGGEKS